MAIDWIEAPTHAAPASTMVRLVYAQSGAVSTTVTFNHSTTTVPLNRAGSAGRRTTIRVVYGAGDPGTTVQWPSGPSAPSAVWAEATPDAKVLWPVHPNPNVQTAIDAGVRAFIQPGGSIRDQEVIDAVNAAGATMVFTGVRHFRH